MIPMILQAAGEAPYYNPFGRPSASPAILRKHRHRHHNNGKPADAHCLIENVRDGLCPKVAWSVMREEAKDSKGGRWLRRKAGR